MAEEPEVPADEGVSLTPEQRRRQRARSIAIACVLAALVALFYIMTVFKLGGNVANRPL